MLKKWKAEKELKKKFKQNEKDKHPPFVVSKAAAQSTSQAKGTQVVSILSFSLKSTGILEYFSCLVVLAYNLMSKEMLYISNVYI